MDEQNVPFHRKQNVWELQIGDAKKKDQRTFKTIAHYTCRHGLLTRGEWAELNHKNIGSFSRKSGFTIVRLFVDKTGKTGKNRELKYIGKSVDTKEEYDDMTMGEVIKEIESDLSCEMGTSVMCNLTSPRGGKIAMVVDAMSEYVPTMMIGV